MKKIIVSIFLLLSVPQIEAKDIKETLDDFMHQAVGSYTSSAQSATDSNYLDLHLTVKNIWQTKDSSSWLLLQTSFSHDTLYPFKQQLFHIYPHVLSLIRLDKYEISDKASFKTTIDSNLAFDTAFLSYITLENNCDLILNRVENIFAIFPSKAKCPNNHRGATYSITDMELEGNEFYIWERGYNARDEQVWGPLNNGYIFLKIKSNKKK